MNSDKIENGWLAHGCNSEYEDDIPSMTVTCPFCEHIQSGPQSDLADKLVVAFDDSYPVSAGHMLIVSRRHVERLRDLTPDEHRALWDMIPAVCERIGHRSAPAGYNIGLNDGQAAGQTIVHVHVHVIPRYDGDAADPRGGIRWVLPERAAYWKQRNDE